MHVFMSSTTNLVFGMFVLNINAYIYIYIVDAFETLPFLNFWKMTLLRPRFVHVMCNVDLDSRQYWGVPSEDKVVDLTVWYGSCRAVLHAPNGFMIYGVYTLIAYREWRQGIEGFQQLLELCCRRSSFGI